MEKIIQKMILALTRKKCQIKTIPEKISETITTEDNNYVMANCGHQTLKKDVLMETGNKIPFDKVPFIFEIEYCDKCLSAMHITCAKCGRLIIIGDKVGLYSPKIKNLKISVNMRFHQGNLITCHRCSEVGVFGKWITPGKVLKRPNLDEVEDSIKYMRENAAKDNFVYH